MSIASELTNLEGNIEDSYDAVNDMGGVIPAQRNMDNLDQAIRTIPQNAGITATTFHWGGSPTYSMYKDSGYTTAATYSDIATAFANGLVYIADGEDEVTYVVVSDIPDAHTITVTGIGLPDYEGGSASYAYASSTWTKTATEFQKKLTAGTNVQINGTTISATDTTYSNFVGTDGMDAGAAGLVPAPATTDVNKYLSSDGSWESIQDRSPAEFYWYNNDLCSENATWTQVDPLDVEFTYLSRPIIIYNYSSYGYESVVSIDTTANIIEAVAVDLLTREPRLVTYKFDDGVTFKWVRTETGIPTQFSDLSGAIGTSQIADGAVTTAKIAPAVLEYRPGDSLTIGNSASGIYWEGRQRASGSNKYIWTQIILDKPISDSVQSISFTPMNYNECFGSQGLVYSLNNPTASEIKYEMYRTDMKHIIRVVITIVSSSISISSNHPCAVNIQGTLTFN